MAVIAVLIAGAAFVGWSAVEMWRARQRVIHVNAREGLHQMAFCLKNYSKGCGHLPELVCEPPSHSQKHSWRVELVRDVEAPSRWPYDELLPWNSAGNLEAAELVRNWFQVRCIPTQGKEFAQILAIDIPGGPWHGNLSAIAMEWPLLALIPESRIGLFEPRDLSIDDLHQIVISRSSREFPIYICSLNGAVKELKLSELTQFEHTEQPTGGTP